MIIMKLEIAEKDVKEVMILRVEERILALRLLEKQKKYPEYAKQIGIIIKMKEKTKNKEK